MPLESERRDYLGLLSLSLSMFCVVAAPLALGALYQPFVGVLGCIALTSLGLHIADRRRQNRSLRTSWLGLIFGASVIATLTMVTPLPEVIRAWLAPGPTAHLSLVKSLLAPEFASQVLPVLSLSPSATTVRLVILITALCVFIVVSDRARDKEEKKYILLWILYGAFALFLTSLGHRLLVIDKVWGIYDVETGTPFYGPLISPNMLARAFAVFALLCFYGALLVQDKLLRYVFTLASVLCGMSVFLTLSRGGILVFIAALFALSILTLVEQHHSKSDEHDTLPYSWLGFTLVAIATLACGLYIASEAIMGELTSLSEYLNGFGKFQLYSVLPSLLHKHWLMGIGQGAFSVEFPSNIQPTLNAPTYFIDQFLFTHIENTPLQTLVDHGLVKGGLLLTICIGIAFVLFKKHFANLSEKILVVALALMVIGDFADFSLESGALLWLSALILGLCAAELSNRGTLALKINWRGATAIVSACSVLVAIFLSPLIPMDYRQLDDTLDALKPNQRHSFLAGAFAQNPFNPQLPYLLAVEARENSRDNEALAFAKVANQLNPIHFGAHVELARAYLLQNKLNQALPEYRLAFMSQPNLGEGVVREASAFAFDMSQRSQVLPEMNATHYILLCEQLIADERFDEAENCFADSLKLKGLKPNHVMRAIDYALLRRRTDMAIQFVRKLQYQGQPDGKVAVYYARVIEQKIGAPFALKATQSWLKEAKDPCPILFWQAQTSLSAKKMELASKAIQLFKECSGAQFSPKDVGLLEAEYLQQNQEPARALEVIRELSQINTSDLSLLRLRMGLELSLNQIDSAEETYALMTQIDPSWPQLLSLQKSLQTQKEAREKERLKEMIQ